MKKFLLSLAVLFAASAVAQKQYKAEEMLSEIPVDEAFLLAGDPDGGQFLTTDGQKNLTTAPDDNALIIFEATGEQTESGFDLYAIKFQATGEYIEDQVITDGMDSSDMLNYKLPYFTTTTDLASAAKWTILPAATRYKIAKDEEGWEENWRTYTGQGTGQDTEESTGNLYPYDGAFVIMRDKLTDGNGNDPVYLEPQSDYTMFAPWGNNDWYLFTYAEKTVDDILQEWWDTNFPEGPDALMEAVGNRIGQYTEESVADLLVAYEAYNNWLIDEVGDAEEILAQSKAALEALKINEMKEGYYYMVSKRQLWAAYDDNGVMRGLRDYQVPTDEETGETTVTLESSKYIWYFTPVAEKENTYIVKNYGTSRYVTTSAHNDNTGIKTGDISKAVDYTVAYHPNFPGTVMLYNLNEKGEMTCAWNIFSGNGGVIGNWMNGGHPETDEGNFFYLYNVADELVDAIAEDVKQFDINSRLQELYEEAVASYQLGKAYVPAEACKRDDDFSNHGFLTYEKDEAGEPVYGEDGLLVSNVKVVANDGTDAIEYSDGQALLGVLDGAANTFIHTKWSGTAYPHFFEIDLGEGNELDAIALKVMRRTQTSEHNASFGFGEAIVYARNSVDEEWVRVANLAMTYDINLYARGEDGQITVDEEGNPVLMSWSADNGENYVGIGAAGLGAKYRYLRLQHYKTLSTTSSGVQQNVYFSASELALFGATYAPEKSLNGAVPAEILAALEAEIAKAKAEIESGKCTEAQIAALKVAYDEYLANFPDPKRLTNALASAKSLAEGLPVETEEGEVGFYPQAALDAFNAVVAEVEATVADVMTLEVINNGVAKLDAAKVALLKSLNMFATGFYQVKMAGGGYEEALLHSSRTAIDTKAIEGVCPAVKGLRAEFAKQTGNVDEGLVDDENYINKVSSVWHFEVGENNKVAIRSLANGLYLQPVLAQSNFVQMTPEKAWLEVQADGLVNGGNFNIILGTDTVPATKGRALYANINSDANLNYGTLISWASASGSDNSTLKFEEVDFANFTYGENTFVLGANKTQFFTLPYDAVMYGQGAKVCEVEGFYTDPETNEMAIYFKNIQEDGAAIKAGQAYLVQTDSETDFLTVSFEEEEVTGFENFNYSYEAKEVNGLQATIFSAQVGPKFGILNLANRVVATENAEENGEVVETTIAPLSGYINTTNMPTLEAAPEGDEYVKIVSLVEKDGLTAIEGVEVAPAAKAGVYTISGVRLNSAKNLPAGIYVINGKKVVK